jgi:hypothetical protein
MSAMSLEELGRMMYEAIHAKSEADAADRVVHASEVLLEEATRRLANDRADAQRVRLMAEEKQRLAIKYAARFVEEDA